MCKLVLGLLVFSLNLNVLWANCTKKIDPSKVMLFLDLNNSALEIETTAKTACERGQRLVVIPKEYKKYATYVSQVELALKNHSNCIKKKKSNCSTEEKQKTTAYAKLGEYNSTQVSIHDALKNEFDEIRNSKASLENFIISGHDGGGAYSGYKSTFSREAIGEILKDYQDINNVKSAMLLGCYTGVQSETQKWQTIFPDVRLIAGYDGSGPLADRPAGHQYIEDILIKEKNIVAQADQKKLNNYVKANLRSLKDINAAIFVKPKCQTSSEETTYYYGSKDPEKSLKPFDPKACAREALKISDLIIKFQKYDAGELEIPKDTANGELRHIYNLARANEHCEEFERQLNATKLFNLLFYEGVTQNFANFYEKDFEKAESIFKSITSDKVLARAEEESRLTEEAITNFEENIKLAQNNPSAYETKLTKLHEKAKEEADKINNDNEIKEIRSKAYDKKPLSPAETTKWNQAREATRKAKFLEMDIREFKRSGKEHTDVLVSKITSLKAKLSASQLTLESFKSKDIMNGIWVPNKDNLNKHTRKELLANIHKISGLLTLPGFDPKEREALSTVVEKSETHLRYMNNPFSWHEFTGHTETPPPM